MNYVSNLFSNVKHFYSQINAATLTGAIDVIVVQQEDGSFLCSPFHVRFGKMGVLRSREKLVDVVINGETVELQMKLGKNGEAFFVQEVTTEQEIPPNLATSPIPNNEHMSELIKAHSKLDSKKYGKPQFTPSQSADMPCNFDCVVDQNYSLQETVPNGHITMTGATDARSIHMNYHASCNGDCSQDIKYIQRPSRPNAFSTTSQKNICDENNRSNSHMPMFQMDDISDNDLDDSITSLDLVRTKSMPNLTVTNMLSSDEQSKPPSRSHSDVYSHFSPGSENYYYEGNDTSSNLSPTSSRPTTPKSDTEYETSSRQGNCKMEPEQDYTWEWGELPRPITLMNSFATTGDSSDQPSSHSNRDNQLSHLSRAPKLMRKSKLAQHSPATEGVSRDQLLTMNELDPDLAALYHTRSCQLLEHDCQKVAEDQESGKGGSTCSNSEESNNSSDSEEVHFSNGMAISLCGMSSFNQEESIPENIFLKGLVSYKDLCLNPHLLLRHDLVVKLDGKNYSWKVAAPIIMSKLMFQQDLPDSSIKLLKKEASNAPQVARKRSWWNWGRSSSAEVADGVRSYNNIAEPTVPSSPITFEFLQQSSESTDDSGHSDGGCEVGEKFQKSLRLTSEQISKLQLRDGCNDVTFSVTTQYQGTARAEARIFLWRYDDRVIISDVDGTITKSDVLGHILPVVPVVGRDWAQLGVAQFFTAIAHNGYRVVYLSARAIGQARMTRAYIQNVQQGEWQLPDGPILLNPSSLVTAFHKEVIQRKSEEFKTSCLRDVQSIFHPSINPFYAGYGNRVNDVWAYRAVGIPLSRIFTINPRGEVRHEMTKTFQTSYTHLRDIVDQLFPPLRITSDNVKVMPFQAAEEFSSFNYWRQPITDIRIEIN